MKTQLYIIAVILASTLASCFSPPEFDDTPAIEYRGISGERTTDPLGNRQDSITVTIAFKDGDGNLGLYFSDTLSPYQSFVVNPDGTREVNFFHHNYHMTVKRMENGVPEEVTFLDGGSVKGRFPVLVEGKGPIEGELNFGRYFLISGSNNSFNDGDSLLFEVRIVDRALNISNTVTSDMIVLGNYE